MDKKTTGLEPLRLKKRVVIDSIQEWCGKKSYPTVRVSPSFVKAMLGDCIVEFYYSSEALNITGHKKIGKGKVTKSDLINIYRITNSIQLLNPAALKAVFNEENRVCEITFCVPVNKLTDAETFKKTFKYAISGLETCSEVFDNYTEYNENSFEKIRNLLLNIAS